jgi:DNA modification methylase
VNDLLSDPSNVRKHDSKNIKAITKSLKRFGQQKPIVVDKDGVVRAGNGTLEAAKNLGWSEIDVVISDLNKKDLKAFAIADNRTAELAAWDDEALAIQLKEMDKELQEIVFEDFEFPVEPVGTSENEDVIPEVDDNPYGVERGDIWLLGKHRLMCGDSTDKADVDRLMDGAKADMVFTDPPYGMFLHSATSELKNRGKDGWEYKPKKYKKVIGDNEDFSPDLIRCILDLNCKETFIWGADYFIEHIPDRSDGSWLIWDKRVHESLDSMLGSMFEMCWSKQKHKREIIRERWIGLHGTEQEHDHKRVHPTQKPTNLAIQFIERWGKDKTLIVDLFLGSGSTLIACEKTDRQCYGMEIDPHYCSVIIKRWEEFSGKEASKA